MSKLIVLVGPPCSGKSTYCRNYKEEYPDTIVVSRDDIRLQLFGKDYKQNNKDEDIVTEVVHATVSSTLSNNKTVILDECHCKKRYLDGVKEQFSYLTDIEFVVMDVEEYTTDTDESIIERLIDRNQNRYEQGKHWQNVPDEVIKKYYNSYKDLKKSYDFSTVEKTPQNPFKPDFKHSPAYIFDIDGTLLTSGHRSHYSASNEEILKDTPLVGTCAIFESLIRDGYIKVLLVTGRKEKHRKATEDWLFNILGINAKSILFMRDDKDNRPDYIVKKEIYEKYIKSNFEVVGVFEDRRQVIKKCWNKLGLFVFDVGQGKNWF